MEQVNKENPAAPSDSAADVRGIVREAIEEYARRESARTEPAYKNELAEERKRREQLERQVNELVQENARSRQMAEEADRSATIRAELQRLGVAKVDLAFRAVKDDVRRGEDGQLVAGNGTVRLNDYLKQFVTENPEFLPARNLGGSGVASAHRSPAPGASTVDLDKIRPGMSVEDLEKARQEISRIASLTLAGM